MADKQKRGKRPDNRPNRKSQYSRSAENKARRILRNAGQAIPRFGVIEAARKVNGMFAPRLVRGQSSTYIREPQRSRRPVKDKEDSGAQAQA